MHSPLEIVINTGPIIALVAALGDLSILQGLYRRVIIPWEVGQEISASGKQGIGVQEFQAAHWLDKWPTPLEISPFLSNSLDKGESAVIQMALNENIGTVCIDEIMGRRIARLHNLFLTGSIGILLRAKRESYLEAIRPLIHRMQAQGIWLTPRVIDFALLHSGEKE